MKVIALEINGETVSVWVLFPTRYVEVDIQASIF